MTAPAGGDARRRLTVEVTPRRVPWPLLLTAALVAGMAWGINARIWMRFVSEDPEFSWGGTLGIVVGFGIAALGQCGAYLGRRSGRGRPTLTILRTLGVATLLPLGGAAGSVMLPTFILVPLIRTQRAWPRAIRGLLALFACAGPVFVITDLFGTFGVVRAVAGILWFAAIYAGIIWAAEFSLGPQRDGWFPPRLVRNIGFVPLVGLSGLAAVALIGAG